MAIEESKREKPKPEEVCTSLSLHLSLSQCYLLCLCPSPSSPFGTPFRLLLSLTAPLRRRSGVGVWRAWRSACAASLTLSLSPSQSSLMELSAVDPWGAPAAPPAVASAGPSPPPTSTAAAAASGPWGPSDPWGAASPTSPVSSDPWGGGGTAVAPPSDPWGDSARVNSDPWGSAGEQDGERRPFPGPFPAVGTHGTRLSNCKVGSRGRGSHSSWARIVC